jgi:hypothetical protein
VRKAFHGQHLDGRIRVGAKTVLLATLTIQRDLNERTNAPPTNRVALAISGLANEGR